MSENNQPVFSIITPTYKRTELLKRAIDSVKNQTFGNYEHIVIDDANDPDTKRIVDELSDGKIIFLVNNSQKGAAGSRNSGIRLAKGKFILFLDDDDEYLPMFLEKMFINFSGRNSETGFLWTGIIVARDTDSGEKKMYTKIWPSRFRSKVAGLIEATTIGNGYGLCVRRECIDMIGLYDESYAMGHDADLLIRLAGRFDFGTIPEALVKIHQHDYSKLTSITNNSLRLEIREKILEKHLNFLQQYPKLYNAHYKLVADLSYSLGQKVRGRKTMFDIISHSPFNIFNYIDLLLYETFGKDASAIYRSDKLAALRHFLNVKSKYLQE